MSADDREARRIERERAERKRPRGHGSITPEESAYRARIRLPDPAGGHREYKKRVGTIREGHAYLDDLLARYQGSGALPAREAENPTFAEFAEQFLESKRAGVSRKTFTTYEVAIRRWLNPVLGTMKMNNIRGADVKRVVEYLRTTPGGRRMRGDEEPSRLSYDSQMVQFRPLKTIMRAAMDAGVVTALPPMTNEFAPQKTHDVHVGVNDVRTRVIDDESLENVLASLDDDIYACTPENHAERRCKASWRVRFALGTRQGEHLSLALGDWRPDTRHGTGTSTLTLHTHIERVPHAHGCDGADADAPSCGKRVTQCPERVDGGIYRLPGFKSNRTGKRKVNLAPDLTAVIQTHVNAMYAAAKTEKRRIKPEEEYLFGQGQTAYSWEQDRRQWHLLWAYANNPESQPPRVHDIRHTVASNLVNGGFPVRHVQKFLGHSDLATTERYLHDTNEGDEMVAAMDMHWTTVAKRGQSGAQQEREFAIEDAQMQEPPDPEELGIPRASDASPFDDD